MNLHGQHKVAPFFLLVLRILHLQAPIISKGLLSFKVHLPFTYGLSLLTSPHGDT